MKFPTIKEIAHELRLINANVECDDDGCDVRLQVYEDGKWWVRYGDSSGDLDHTGYWGSGSVPGVVHGKVMEFDSRAVAKDLINDVREAYYTRNPLDYLKRGY